MKVKRILNDLVTDNAWLMLGDCLEKMARIPDESVDLIITSPPYNLGNNHHTENKRHNPYEDNMPEDKYQEWQIKVINECHRVLRNTGSMFYNHKNRIKKGLQITPYEWLLKTKMLVKQELVWMNGSPNFDKIRFYPHTERLYWLAKDPQTKLYNSISHNDVFNWASVGTKGVHKRAFPEKMIEDIIACFPDSKTVLDPYAGSGTVGLICKKTNRNYILIELDETYYNVMVERLK